MALELPAEILAEYKELEHELKRFLKTERKAANKVLSAYLNLLMAYPDQPYGQKPIINPLSGEPIVIPQDMACVDDILPKEQAVLDIVARKLAAGEKVMIYTNWTRLDTQEKLKKRLTAKGYRTEILRPKVKPKEREKWVEKQLSKGLQVLITNPRLVETGLDMNEFTTLIFYDTGFKLFTLRQAARRSWRINQKAPRVEVYMLYYQNTMQHKAIRLMASKLAVAGVIEGQYSDEGLAAMSECEDLTTIMAQELAQGIAETPVEDVAAMYKRMAFLKPKRAEPEAPAQVTVPEPAPTQVLDFSSGEARGHALLLRSQEFQAEARKQKKKKYIFLEGQTSLFGEIA